MYTYIHIYYTHIIHVRSRLLLLLLLLRVRLIIIIIIIIRRRRINNDHTRGYGTTQRARPSGGPFIRRPRYNYIININIIYHIIYLGIYALGYIIFYIIYIVRFKHIDIHIGILYICMHVLHRRCRYLRGGHYIIITYPSVHRGDHSRGGGGHTARGPRRRRFINIIFEKCFRLPFLPPCTAIRRRRVVGGKKSPPPEWIRYHVYVIYT